MQKIQKLFEFIGWESKKLPHALPPSRISAPDNENINTEQYISGKSHMVIQGEWRKDLNGTEQNNL